ncbi:hypothetical protein ACJJTC_007607 [Scirpophaga incertulas]
MGVLRSYPGIWATRMVWRSPHGCPRQLAGLGIVFLPFVGESMSRQAFPASQQASAGASWEALDAYNQEAGGEKGNSRSRLPRKSTPTPRRYTPEWLAPLKGMHPQVAGVERREQNTRRGRLSEVLLRPATWTHDNKRDK